MKKLNLVIFLLFMSVSNVWAGEKSNVKADEQKSKPRVFLMAFGSPKDMEKVKRYKNTAGPVMKKHGAMLPPMQFNVDEVIAGNSNPKFLNYIEFPDKESILNALSDPDYLKVVNGRDNGFLDLNIFIITQ